MKSCSPFDNDVPVIWILNYYSDKMSLSSLISGADCALPSNPLHQVLKHTEGDRSIQRVCHPRTPSAEACFLHLSLQDRVAGPSSSRVGTCKSGYCVLNCSCSCSIFLRRPRTMPPKGTFRWPDSSLTETRSRQQPRCACLQRIF